MYTIIKHATILALGFAMVQPVIAADDDRRQQAAANFQAADANGDRALTFSEFTRLIDLNAQYGIGRATMVQSRGAYQMAFSRIDADGDGIVTTDEILALSDRAQR